MRVLVCGGRDYPDSTKVAKSLDAMHKKHGVDVVITGGANGADRWAQDWARTHGVAAIVYHAAWSKGKGAGPERNQLMLEHGKPDCCVAFPGGRGTAHMVGLVKAAGLPVWEVG